MPTPPAPSRRIDKWLWCARVTKSRTGAQGLIAAGHVRVNRQRVLRSSQELSPGDVLTIALRMRVRVMKVTDFAARRGPPSQAQDLYEELTPPGNA